MATQACALVSSLVLELLCVLSLPVGFLIPAPRGPSQKRKNIFHSIKNLCDARKSKAKKRKFIELLRAGSMALPKSLQKLTLAF